MAKNKPLMIKVCMFCGEEHADDDSPLICDLKGSAASALLEALSDTEVIFILDRTNFLKVFEDNLRAKKIVD